VKPALALCVAGRDDVLDHGALLGGLREQLGDGRLVRDQRAHPVRVAGDQGEPGDGAAAAAEHVRRGGAEGAEDRGDVVGPQLRRGVLLRIVEGAVRDPPRVRGDDRVVGGHGLGQRRELGRRHRGAENQQQRTRAADLVVQVRAGDIEGAGRGHGVLLGGCFVGRTAIRPRTHRWRAAGAAGTTYDRLAAPASSSASARRRS
jgi:hypothetical protein